MNLLLIVDVQYDFIWGSLAVAGAEKIVDPIVELANDSEYDFVISTRDYHPANHVSFVRQGGPWPPHCVQDTFGCRIHPKIELVSHVIISKGMNPNKEAYSGFDCTFLGKGKIGRIRNVTVVGLATDYCVKATALDAFRYSSRVEVVQSLCRGVDSKTTKQALKEMDEKGVRVI